MSKSFTKQNGDTTGALFYGDGITKRWVDSGVERDIIKIFWGAELRDQGYTDAEILAKQSTIMLNAPDMGVGGVLVGPQPPSPSGSMRDPYGALVPVPSV